MKVKIGELKTHLSRYVQGLREGGEPVEVCVREEAVAYLTAADPGTGPAHAREMKERVKLLEGSGLHLRELGVRKQDTLPPAGRPGDGLNVENSVADMRAGKHW